MAGSVEALMPAHPDLRLAFFDPDFEEGDGVIPYLRVEPAAGMALVREGTRTRAVLLTHDDRGELIPASKGLGFLGSFYKQDQRDRFGEVVEEFAKSLPRRPRGAKVKGR